MIRFAILILLLSLDSGFSFSVNRRANSISFSVHSMKSLVSQKTTKSSLLASVPSDFPRETRSEPPRLQYAILWTSLVLYAFGVSPGGSESAVAMDNEILQKVIFTPYDGTLNPIFVAIFNYLGVLPAIYAGLLLPGAKNQTVPALPFVLSAFAMGFFGIGPYLGLRNINTEAHNNPGGIGPTSFYSSKLTAVLLLFFASFQLYYATSNTFGGGNTSGLQDFLDLFMTSRTAHVSTIDLVILSLAVITLVKRSDLR